MLRLHEFLDIFVDLLPFNKKKRKNEIFKTFMSHFKIRIMVHVFSKIWSARHSKIVEDVFTRLLV